MKKYPLHSNVKHKKHIIFYRALWFLFILTTKSVKSTHKTKLQTTCYFSTYFLEIQLVANFSYIGCVPVLVEGNIKQRSFLEENKEQWYYFNDMSLVSNCCYSSFPRDCGSMFCLNPSVSRFLLKEVVLAFYPSYLFPLLS